DRIQAKIVLFRSRPLGNGPEAQGAAAASMSIAKSLCGSARYCLGARAHGDERGLDICAVERARRAPRMAAKKLAQFIEEHLADEISLSSLAQLVRLSPFHFSRAFKESFGMPPHRYLTHQRIERAKGLLAARQLSVTEIGLDVGFSETSSCTAAFRKVTGETPTEYRRSVA